jgi:hypothetical protein
LTYRAGEAVYEYRISRADWQLIESLRDHLPAEVELLFIVPALGSEVCVPTNELRTAADRVAAFFMENSDLLPYTYQFKCERSPDPRIASGGFGTGGMSGLRLPGDKDHYYLIRAGLNECSLEKMAVGPDGRGFTVDKRDLRGESQLLTETVGKISIRRSRAKSELRQAVGEIRLFLQNVKAHEVTKTVA